MRAITLAVALLSFAAAASAEEGVIAPWGDSLTHGVGASDQTKTSYPAQLAAMLKRKVRNDGGGPSQTSTQVISRQGGVPIYLVFEGDTISLSRPTAVTESSVLPLTIYSPAPQEISGTVCNVHGRLRRVGGYASPDDTYVFEAYDTASKSVACPRYSRFTPDLALKRRDEMPIFWVGRNNTTQTGTIVNDLKSAVAYIGGPNRRFVVLSILSNLKEPSFSPGALLIGYDNAQIKAAFPNNFLDVNYPPTPAEWRFLGVTPSQDDLADSQRGNIPRSLHKKNDPTHLNDLGYRLIAHRVASYVRAKGW